jgi:hypothetical protein
MALIVSVFIFIVASRQAIILCLPNALVSDPEPVCTASKDANPKGSLEQPVVLGMGSKTILPEGH